MDDKHHTRRILDGTGGNDNVLFPEYQTYMSITDNGYGNGFANSFAGGSINESVGNMYEQCKKEGKCNVNDCAANITN
jgi:alpha-amylase